MAIPDTVPFIGIGWDDVLFLILAGGMIGTALLVVVMRDIIRCGLAMMLCFGALAGLYVLLGSPFLAATQVLVYIGAISVLILFAIMLTQSKAAPARLVFQTQAIPAAVAAVVLVLVLAVTVTATDWGSTGARMMTGTEALATIVFNEYVLAFEVVAILITAAVIGAIFLARRETAWPEGDAGSVVSPRSAGGNPR